MMTSGNQTTAGWVIFVGAVGMMFGMLAVDVASLKEWFPMFGAEYNIMTDTWTLGLTWPVQKRLWRGLRRPWGWNR